MTFELAGGSVVGTDHRAVPRNNQDAWVIERRERSVCAVVADGCGSGEFSEVGAQLSARILASQVASHANAYDFLPWDLFGQGVLSEFHDLAGKLGGDWTGRAYRRAVEDYFLASLVGVVLYRSRGEVLATFFGCGDGLVVVNGDLRYHRKFPNNAPPYLAYRLLGGYVDAPMNADASWDDLALTVYEKVYAEDIESFLIGCDGAGDPGLLEVCGREGQMLPGFKNLSVGPISQFWTGDHYFSNPVAISRRLKLIARDWPPRNPERGLLADDTTIVVGRRA